MKIWVENTTDKLAAVTADYIAKYIRNHPNTLLCFAAGETPLKMLDKLVELQTQREVNLSSVRYVGLDEWQGIGYETKGSCSQVMRDHFYIPAGISEDRILLWDGNAKNPDAECIKIDNWIESSGGIDLLLLGVGMNGHIGFNEPGASMNHPCMIVGLDEVTANVGRKYFDGGVCPSFGMTIGMPRLLQSKEVLLMATGAQKAPIIRKALIEKISTLMPASQLQKCHKLTVCLDQDLWRNL